MNTPTTTPPKIDEKAQLGLTHANFMGTMVLRYRTVKKAEQHYKLIQSTWQKMAAGKHDGVLELKADMFEATVNLGDFAAVSFTNIEKRLKFIPYQ